ncbi:MAG: HAD-IB family phosphatase [Pseudomonadota bacterium]
MGQIKGVDLCRKIVEDLQGEFEEVTDREALKKILDENCLGWGVQQRDFFASVRFREDVVNDAVSAYDMLEKIQGELLKGGERLDYIPCQYVYDEELCRTLKREEFIIWTPRITKEMVVDAARKQKIFAPKTTRHLIPARPLNVNVPTMWFKENHIVTILGEDQPGIIARVSAFFHHHNINIEHCRMIARGKFFSMEMRIDTNRMSVDPSLSREEAIEKMKGELRRLCAELNQSMVIQSENIFNKGKKLVVFDVESTLIQESSLRDFLERIQGEFRSPEWEIRLREEGQEKMGSLLENARLLKGIPISDFEKFGECLELNPGTLELIVILKSMGFKIALLSSGFNFFVKRIFEAAGVDYAFSNSLRVDEKGVITGQLEEPVITGATKGEILDFIMHMENIRPEQVIAVGDGSIGSHFISNVGLSIAFKPDEKSIRTDGVLSTDRLTSMLYCLGVPKADLDRFLKEGS